MAEILALTQASADSVLISGPNGPGFGMDDPRLLASQESPVYEAGIGEHYSFEPDMIAAPDDPFFGLTEKQREVVDEIRKMDSVPFLDQVPFLADPRGNEQVALHEWGHAEVAMRNGITVLGMEVKDRGNQKGVTWLSGIHSYDAFLRTATAGAAAAGSYGLAGDKAAVDQIAQKWDVDGDTLFKDYQKDAAADFHAAVPDPSERKWVPVLLTHLERIHGGDLELVKRRAKLDARIEEAGLTREQVMSLITPEQQAKEKQQRQAIEEARKLIPPPDKRTEIIITDQGDVVNHYDGNKLIDTETYCPVCRKPVRECGDVNHKEYTEKRFNSPVISDEAIQEEKPTIGDADGGIRDGSNDESAQTTPTNEVDSSNDTEGTMPKHRTIFIRDSRNDQIDQMRREERQTIRINGVTYPLYPGPDYYDV